MRQQCMKTCRTWLQHTCLLFKHIYVDAAQKSWINCVFNNTRTILIRVPLFISLFHRLLNKSATARRTTHICATLIHDILTFVYLLVGCLWNHLFVYYSLVGSECTVAKRLLPHNNAIVSSKITSIYCCVYYLTLTHRKKKMKIFVCVCASQLYTHKNVSAASKRQELNNTKNMRPIQMVNAIKIYIEVGVDAACMCVHMERGKHMSTVSK